MFASDPLITGLTLSGGDPMEQAAECARLAALAKSNGRDVWTYTGYTYEQLLAEGDPDRLALLEQSDVLVDGPFILKEKSYDALFRGSRNQRLIDLNATRRTGVLTLWQRQSTLSHFKRPES
jgi:anaerobic ribonucleoside-triphosphate reductase activating protein